MDKYVNGRLVAMVPAERDERLAGLAAWEAAAPQRQIEADKAALAASDAAYIRVIDDVIAVLIGKGVISETDLPAAAQEKRAARAILREKVTA